MLKRGLRIYVLNSDCTLEKVIDFDKKKSDSAKSTTQIASLLKFAQDTLTGECAQKQQILEYLSSLETNKTEIQKIDQSLGWDEVTADLKNHRFFYEADSGQCLTAASGYWLGQVKLSEYDSEKSLTVNKLYALAL